MLVSKFHKIGRRSSDIKAIFRCFHSIKVIMRASTDFLKRERRNTAICIMTQLITNEKKRERKENRHCFKVL